MRRIPVLAVALAGLILLVAPAHDLGACPLHRTPSMPLDGYFPALQAGLTQLFNELIGDHDDPVTRAPTVVEVDAPPEEVGHWVEPMDWPVLGIHTALLATADVLQFSYPYFGDPGSRARRWDPGSGTFESLSWDENVFCSGHAYLPNGKLLLVGGNTSTPGCDTAGERFSHVFDPFNGRWQRKGNMARPRWYPTALTLGDGRILTLSGLDDVCAVNPLMEIYTSGEGWEVIPEGERALQLYPRMHLLSDGRIAHVGPEVTSWVFDLENLEWQSVDETRYGRPRYEGTSFQVPGSPDKVMICGGFQDYNAFPTDTCEQIDFAAADPKWKKRAPMHFARAHPGTVLLPDGKVLVVGGGTSGLYDDPILNPELYDPAANRWELLPAQTYGRMYHATATLLPDGRVLSSGQDDDASDGVQSGDWGEIYEPPYLFRGPRPEITEVNKKKVKLGKKFKITTPEASEIVSVVLLGLTQMTHSVNTGQRYVPLEFEQVADDKLKVTSPADGNLAPPGYYMLFILDGDDVPSEAKMLRLKS